MLFQLSGLLGQMLLGETSDWIWGGYGTDINNSKGLDYKYSWLKRQHRKYF